MTPLPRLALSVRQPWAHALVMGWKAVENRSWRAPNPALKFRGPVAIHASRGLTRHEYDEAAEFFDEMGFECPAACDLLRGGIVGAGVIVDIVKTFDSPWFFGPRGLVIADAEPVDFIPCAGALGFFEWERGRTDEVPAPARWMRPRPAAPASPQGSLL